MKITWMQFHRDDSLFELWCADRSSMFEPAPEKHDIFLYCMIEDDVLICKIRSPNKQDIPEILYPQLTNYESVKFYDCDATNNSCSLLGLCYFEITNTSEIIQFRLTHS